ncbi:MAG: glycosyltransferase family 4 protein [Chloroflexi bacterium]|nr:glycosyltransferase family 4 protein [Chloroflexota bacterium]
MLTLVFPPDSVSTAQIMGDLAVDLRSRGHDVVVLTTSPHYNRDLEAEARQPLRSCWGAILQRSDYQGIPVYHVIMPRKGASLVARVLPWLSFHILSTLAGLTVVPRTDLTIVPSPPITIGLVAWLLKLLRRSRYIYNVQEIYPDSAISLGAIRNQWLIRLLFWLEKFVYDQAVAVTVIAPYMARRLYEKGVSPRKVQVIPNFVDAAGVPLTKDNDFSRRHSVNAKFMVSYAGNLGPAQDLATYIEAANILRGRQDIHFMLMGDGMLRESLRRSVVDLKLDNFTFLPYQPYSLMPQIHAASDLCLVPQARGIANLAVPSKVYRIMASARPVLACTVVQSDLANLVMDAQCGIVVEAGSPERLAEAIVDAFNHPARLQAMGLAGRQRVMECYSRQTISGLYHTLVRSVVAKNDNWHSDWS